MTLRATTTAGAAGLVLAAMVLPAGPADAAPRPSTRVFTDPAGDVTSGVDLLRTRVTNRATLRVTTKHENLRRRAYGTQFIVYVDTRRDRRGPEYAVAGGLSAGTDWSTGRATRNWRFTGDPLDDIGTCRSEVEIDWARDRLRVVLDRDCLGGHQGRVRVAVRVGDGTGSDWGRGTKRFYGGVPRG